MTICLKTAIVLFVVGTATLATETKHGGGFGYQGVLVSPSQVSEQTISEWRSQGNQIVLRADGPLEETIAAANMIAKLQDGLEYFFEVARSSELAQAHPEWMASIQGHQEWRRFHPNLPEVQPEEVVKVFPWVPIFYQEAFDTHVERIDKRLNTLPKAQRLWLNDIQGAPSACGCGHPLCRWTSDYGPKKTGTVIGDAAPARFVAALSKKFPGTKVTPILTTECEKHDQHELCAGVGCFEGICWRAFSRQLEPLTKSADHIGLACFYKAFQRDLPRYGEPGAWTKEALALMETMPPQRGGKGIKPDRLIAVLQGWQVPQSAIKTQLDAAHQAGAAGVLLALTPVDQSWTPKILALEALEPN